MRMTVFVGLLAGLYLMKSVSVSSASPNVQPQSFEDTIKSTSFERFDQAIEETKEPMTYREKKMMNDAEPQNNTTTNQSLVTSKAANKAALPEYGKGEAIDGLGSDILASNPGSIIHKPQDSQEHQRDIAIYQ